MSKQLTFSATLSIIAMAALTLVTAIDGTAGGGRHPATAHGSIAQVLLQL